MSDLIERQAAIDALMTILDKPNHAEFLYTDEICKVLNDLPSAQPDLQQTCNKLATDCISRQAAIDIVSKWIGEVFGVYKNGDNIGVFRQLRELPSEAERKTNDLE